MKKIIILLLICILQSCGKPKTVLICGDHICVNKAEAEQFFEENLSIEVRIVDNKKKDQLDLVELNLKENSNENKKITMKRKENTNNKIKILSSDEKKKIIKEVKIKNKKNKDSKVTSKDNKNSELIVSTTQENNLKIEKKDIRKEILRDKKIVDVCTILERCNIDEISKYLIKEGRKKSFPNITIRE